MLPITIGIPTKNRPATLCRLLTSILASVPTGHIQEILIVDGSYTLDENVRRMEGVVMQHHPIRHILSNRSLVKTRRYMLELCNSEYLYMIDDDVVLTPTFLDVYPFDSSNGKYAFICPRILNLWYRGKQFLSGFPEELPLLPYEENSKRVPLKYIETAAALACVEKLLKAECFTDSRSFGEFVDASFRLHNAGMMGLYEPNALVYDNKDTTTWVGPEWETEYPFPKEFNPYMKEVK